MSNKQERIELLGGWSADTQEPWAVYDQHARLRFYLPGKVTQIAFAAAMQPPAVEACNCRPQTDSVGQSIPGAAVLCDACVTPPAAPAHRSAWRSMDSAPKNDTILCMTKAGIWSFMSEMRNGQWWYASRVKWEKYPKDDQPVLWMPMPNKLTVPLEAMEAPGQRENIEQIKMTEYQRGLVDAHGTHANRR